MKKNNLLNYIFVICLCTLGTLNFSSSAIAEESSNAVKRACIKEANQDWRQAVKDADFELKSSKATCRFGPEVAACMTACLPTFQTCLQPVVQRLKSCRKTCGDTLVATRKAARESIGCGNLCNVNADFQKAAIAANISFEQCNINCRSSTESINARAGCRIAHGLCVNACKN